LGREHPDQVVSRMQKALRKGKVLIDWSQNDKHKTTVSVYSLRARERPTVSTPVTWQELEAAMESRDPNRLSFDSDTIAPTRGETGRPVRSGTDSETAPTRSGSSDLNPAVVTGPTVFGRVDPLYTVSAPCPVASEPISYRGGTAYRSSDRSGARQRAWQRKPSHFGSYCHASPTGRLSTNSASMGRNGGWICSCTRGCFDNPSSP
jgi:LigD-like primase-polymerase